MMKPTKMLFFISILAICSCQSTNHQRQTIYQDYITEKKLKAIKNIRTFKFQGWSSLDHKNLLLSSSHQRNYLLTLSNYCPEILSTNSIYFDQSMSGRLSSQFDYVIVPGQENYKCKIDQIYEIEKHQKSELIRLRKDKS